MPVGITLTIEARDAQGKRTHVVPGIATYERAADVARDLFTLAAKRAELTELEAALSKGGKPKTERTSPAYVPLTGLDNGDRCGWHMEARTGKERFCAITKGHDLKPGMGGGHMFEEPPPPKAKA